MVSRLLIATAAVSLTSCGADTLAATQPQEILPVRIKDPEIAHSLRGWTKAPRPHSANRIVFNTAGYKDARALTFTSSQMDWEAGLINGLAKEGLSTVKVLARRDVQGAIVHDFGIAASVPGSTLRSWIASAEGPQGTYKIAGYSLINPSGDDPGVSYELFVAPAAEFERLGGFMVAAVRYADTVITDAPTSMSEWGSLPDSQAVEIMDQRMAALMYNIVRARVLQGAMTQQTLGMLKGLCANGDYGLDDPMYDF